MNATQFWALAPVYYRRPINWVIAAYALFNVFLLYLAAFDRPREWVQSTTNFPPYFRPEKRLYINDFLPFASSASAKSLEQLTLSNARIDNTQPNGGIYILSEPLAAEIIQGLAQFKSLKRLELEWIEKPEKTDWQPLSQLARLQHLSINTSGMNDDSLGKFLERLPAFDGLQSLTLPQIQSVHSSRFAPGYVPPVWNLSSLARYPRLTQLSLTAPPADTPFKAIGLGDLSSLKTVVVVTHRTSKVHDPDENGRLRAEMSTHPEPICDQLIAELRRLPKLTQVFIDSDNSQIDWLFAESARVSQLLPRVLVRPGRMMMSHKSGGTSFIALLVVSPIFVIVWLNLISQFGHPQAHLWPRYAQIHQQCAAALIAIGVVVYAFVAQGENAGDWSSKFGTAASLFCVVACVFWFLLWVWTTFHRQLGPNPIAMICFVPLILIVLGQLVSSHPASNQIQSELMSGKHMTWTAALMVVASVLVYRAFRLFELIPRIAHEAGMSTTGVITFGNSQQAGFGSISSRLPTSEWQLKWPALRRHFKRLQTPLPAPQSMWEDLQRSWMRDPQTPLTMPTMGLIMIGAFWVMRVGVHAWTGADTLSNIVVMGLFQLKSILIPVAMAVWARTLGTGYELARGGSRLQHFTNALYSTWIYLGLYAATCSVMFAISILVEGKVVGLPAQVVPGLILAEWLNAFWFAPWLVYVASLRSPFLAGAMGIGGFLLTFLPALWLIVPSLSPLVAVSGYTVLCLLLGGLMIRTGRNRWQVVDWP